MTSELVCLPPFKDTDKMTTRMELEIGHSAVNVILGLNKEINWHIRLFYKAHLFYLEDDYLLSYSIIGIICNLAELNV